MRERGARNVFRGAAAASVAACALALAACGGDDSPIEPIDSTTSTTTTGGALSQDDFITAADPRCAEANVAIANLSDDSTLISQESSITRGLQEDLQAIGEGDDPDGSLADFFSALNDQVRILKQQVTALNEGDTTTVASLDVDLEAAKSAAASAATSYGFEDCGGTGETLPDDGTTTVPVTPTDPATPAPVTPAPATPAPVTPAPVDPGDTGGGTPPATPAPTPTPTPDPGGGSGGIGVG